MKSSRKIEISKASLISLKAELSRKQEEVSKAKVQGAYIHPVPQPKKQTVWTKENTGVSERKEKDFEQLKEEEDIFKKSRLALEAKSKLYDKLSQDSTGHDDTFLVDFQQKINEEEQDNVSDEYEDPSDPEEDWVDYTDCLGRTRRCLRKDLAYIKEKDADLFKSLGGDIEDKQKEAEPEAEPELQSGDMRRELLRQKWEQQEEELRSKTDIHYQDVLFDEARSHGVGYYEFSQDEATRRSQQESLQKLRQETQREQAAIKDVKERRRLQLEARLKAARRRQRERFGLPLEEEQELQQEQQQEPEMKEEPEKDKDTKPLEEPKPTQVRPWDFGKEGVRDVMSQEDWVKKKRIERPHEFAPPPSYQADFIPTIEQEEARPKSTLFFSSKKPSSCYQQDFIRTPMKNETRPKSSKFFSSEKTRSDDGREKIQRLDVPSSSKGGFNERGHGVEIPPPPTFDYYGPSSSVPREKATGPSDLESSITAGLKYLRQQAEERDKKRDKGLLDII